MTTEQLKQTAAAMLDAAAGKIIQCRNPNYPDAEWSDLKPHNASWEFTLNEYRPKPGPVSRPWNCPADVPGPLVWIVEESRRASECLVTSVSPQGVTYATDSNVRFVLWSEAEKWGRLLYSTDRKEWKKCEVTEPAR